MKWFEDRFPRRRRPGEESVPSLLVQAMWGTRNTPFGRNPSGPRHHHTWGSTKSSPGGQLHRGIIQVQECTGRRGDERCPSYRWRPAPEPVRAGGLLGGTRPWRTVEEPGT